MITSFLYTLAYKLKKFQQKFLKTIRKRNYLVDILRYSLYTGKVEKWKQKHPLLALREHLAGLDS